MTCSKMLREDLKKLECKYSAKYKKSFELLEKQQTETAANINHHCYMALEQIRRIRAIVERAF